MTALFATVIAILVIMYLVLRKFVYGNTIIRYEHADEITIEIYKGRELIAIIHK